MRILCCWCEHFIIYIYIYVCVYKTQNTILFLTHSLSMCISKFFKGDYISVVRAAARLFKNFIIIGKRTQADLEMFELSKLGSSQVNLGTYNNPNITTLEALAAEYREGSAIKSRNPSDNIDYFFYSKNAWDENRMKPLAWGRAFCDNYLLRKYLDGREAPVLIDASEMISALHFMHNYNHIQDAGGITLKSWEQSEESDDNRRMAREDNSAKFATLKDVTHVVKRRGGGMSFDFEPVSPTIIFDWVLLLNIGIVIITVALVSRLLSHQCISNKPGGRKEKYSFNSGDTKILID
jgi:hypothetical protein